MTDFPLLTSAQLGLSPEHDKVRIDEYKDIDPAWFAYQVCNNFMVLPQAKIDTQWHVPICAPGKTGGRGWGWRDVDFVIVMPAISYADRDLQGCLLGRSGQFFADVMKRVGLYDGDVLVTHALRFALPDGVTAYSAKHKAACQPYVRADCYACQPKAILTLGSDALKCLFGPQAKLDTLRGGIAKWMDIPVVPSISPAVFAGTTAGIEVFEREVASLIDISMHNYVSGCNVSEGYRVCTNLQQVLDLEEHLKQFTDIKLSIDTEFGNLLAREEFGKLRSMQMAWGAGQAAYIRLRGCGMVECHSPDDLEAIKRCLERILTREDVRLEGHHLRVDIEMPSREGINIDHKLGTGFCTLLARHLMHGSEGDESDGLDHIVRAYVPQFGNYWRDLETWLDTGSAVMNGETVKGRRNLLRFGYGFVPDDIIEIYGLYDADATWQAARLIEAELDTYPKLKKLFWEICMPCSLHLLDVQRQGIKVDLQHIAELRAIYKPEYDAILAQFREAIEWPDFNPNSGDQKASFLFSKMDYKKKKPAPDGAKVLDLMPLFDTAKYPVEWRLIIENNEELKHSPSTKAATLELLAIEYPEIHELKMLRQLSVLGKFISTYLPEEQTNEFGVRKDGKQIIDNIWADGRVRCNIFQTSSSGRYRASKPNLQTTPKRQEEAALGVFTDRRLGMSIDKYRHRTDAKNREKLGALYIPPEQQLQIPQYKTSYIEDTGWCLMEADFKNAEIGVLAYASGDTELIAIVEQGRDIHAETAASAFKLPELQELPEAITDMKKKYKPWLEHFKEMYPGLRTAAKTVVFGINYGRGSGALAREIGKAGVEITKAECQMIIDAIAKKFPRAWAYLQGNAAKAVELGFCETAFGRKRYFKGIQQMSAKDQASARREAMATPIQGCVADLLAVAGINLYNFRYHTEEGRALKYKILLPIHDAFLFAYPDLPGNLEKMKVVLPLCMSTLNKIPGTDKSLAISMENFPERWGIEGRTAHAA